MHEKTPRPTPTSLHREGIEEEAISPNLEKLLALQAEIARQRDAALEEIHSEISRLETIHASNMAKLRGLLGKVGGSATTTSVGSDIPLSPSHSTRFLGSKYCPYCMIPGHDGRAHRGQPKPRPFNVEELRVFGYVPPSGLPVGYGESEKIA